MGLFNIFKKKTKETANSEEKVMYYYLYGFVNSDPNFQFRDQDLAERLYKKIIGNKAGIQIGNSFYPYCTIDEDGVNVWDFAFIYLLKNDADFMNNLKKGGLILLELSTKFNKVILWEDDTRLTFEENPFFGKAVPFIIPFVVLDHKRDTNFDKMILKELKEHQHAHNYIEEINAILKEFMHETAFTIGFDEFKFEDKNKIIDNFINAKALFDNVRNSN